MPTRYVLRDLPGVAELEARIARVEAHPNPQWAPERDGLSDAGHLLCQRLFATTWLDTYFDHAALDDDPDWEYDQEEHDRLEAEWEQHFKFLDAEDNQRAVIWNALGWDVTDGKGGELPSLEFFDRSIVCAAKSLRGRLPDAALNDDEIQERAEDWAEGLAAEAAKFRRGQR